MLKQWTMFYTLCLTLTTGLLTGLAGSSSSLDSSDEEPFSFFFITNLEDFVAGVCTCNKHKQQA